MSAPPALLEALAAQLGEPVDRAEPVAGGDINDAWRAEMASGDTVFVKSRAGASRADFEAEAAGLRWLREADAIRLPEVLGVGGDPAWLALEWVEAGRISPAGAEELGAGLAAVHRAGAGAHGALPPGQHDGVLRIGAVELRLADAEGTTGERSWPDVYAWMLGSLLAQARERGAIEGADGEAIESVCERMPELAGPPEDPARLHGDLWSGNVMGGADGRPWLIDPAAYGGHREVDLAMLKLFGSPSAAMLDAYDREHPLDSGHAERVELWQILPLLVHAILFGGQYGASAGRAARRYS